MFNKNKKLIEKIVDIKNQLSKYLISLIIITLPLNQQYHFRPFPSVDGFIIDYLILKVSIVEILIYGYFFLNIRQIINSVKSLFKYKIFWISFICIFFSIIQSKYLSLAIYENFTFIVFLFLAVFLIKNPENINKNLLAKSVKFWILALSLLGFLQFYSQSSVFNNYSFTGEFPYSDDYYHIKQKNIFLGEMIPPYAIFAHSNIFGAYLVLLCILLSSISMKNNLFYFLVGIDLLLIGSVACLIAFMTFFVLKMFSTSLIKKTLVGIFLISWGLYFLNSFDFEKYFSDYSVYRRLYMFDLSSNFFIDNPKVLFFGSGYYNYFSYVKGILYEYELVRFFQPPHFLLYFIIWQYGLIFLLIIFYLIFKNFRLLNKETLLFLAVLLVFSSFDHYLLTNHQLKVLIVFILPYSLKSKNSI